MINTEINMYFHQTELYSTNQFQSLTQLTGAWTDNQEKLNIFKQSIKLEVV